MGFFDDFFGKSQRRDVQSGHEDAQRYLNRGYDDAARIGQDYYGQARADLAPWMQSGNRANALYDSALGVNGRDAQAGFMANYQGDPFRQHNQDMATRQVQRQFNARGMDTSGNALLAAARASQERGSQDYGAYLDRLAGQAGRGAQMAQAGAGLTSQFGNQLSGLRYGHGQQLAAENTNYANAMAQSRNVGMQNLFGLAGTAAKAYGAYAGGGGR